MTSIHASRRANGYDRCVDGNSLNAVASHSTETAARALNGRP